MSENKEKKQEKYRHMIVPIEMIQILDVIRDNVDHLTWRSMQKIPYTEAFRILAAKIREKGIVAPLI